MVRLHRIAKDARKQLMDINCTSNRDMVLLLLLVVVKSVAVVRRRGGSSAVSAPCSRLLSVPRSPWRACAPL